uniref:Uncharacterized protein n=2 Tax=Micromonas pusilla TaxID=38833 RepID=A0A7S0NJ22_MICPS|mmetsp:Transcript_13390/g.56630  ORF Transcript_13390/g.56630 Transcript_13390/m.56630 type:complete len:825 (+) Transcript_13390:53-2527(+)
MRVTRVFLFIALVAGLIRSVHGVECNIARAIELFPCKADEGKELTATQQEECCNGIYKNNVELPGSGSTTDRWANSGCFCVKEITSLDKSFFNNLLKEAKKCANVDKTDLKCSSTGANGLDACDASVFDACPSTLPDNGFVGKTQAQIKAEVEARPAKIPPAPPAISIPPTATAKKVQIDLRLKDATGFLGDSAAAKSKRKELEDNLAKALCSCASPTFKVKLVSLSKGSTIVKAEVVKEGGSLNSQELADIQTQTSAGLGSSPTMSSYGDISATVPAPAPAGQAPAPIRESKDIALPSNLDSPPAKLPGAVTGLPRIGLDGSEYDGGFNITNTDYQTSVAGQMLPGVVMAVLLLVIMILMLVVYIVATLCGLTFCKCCNGAYKPRRFSKKDLKINKLVCLVFCAVTAAGAFTVFAETPPLLENTKDLTGAMADTISELTKNVTKIADAMDAAAGDPLLKIGDVSSTTTSMKDAMKSVDDTVQKAQDQIEEYVDMSGLYVTIAAGVMFGITFIVFALGLIGFWRLLIFFTIILSIMMVVGWIVWGLLSLLTVFVDDLCWAMNDYLRDRYNSDLSELIPCMDPDVAVKTMNVAREQVATGIAAVNDQLEEYAGSNPYLKYLCYNYAKVPLKDLCTKPTIYHELGYSRFVCEAENKKKLKDKTTWDSWDAQVQDLMMFPDAFCPYPTDFYSVPLGDFSTGLRPLRCPFKGYDDNDMTQVNEFNMGQCYTMKQIPSDVFDAKAATANLAQTVLDIVPIIESLLQCELVSTAFSRMVGPCDGMATALTSLYTGFLLVAMGYFLLWASTLVIISRLQYYRSYCVDADKY